MPDFNPSELAAWCGGQWRSGIPDTLSGFCHDTRTLGPDALYVAISGERLDGHDFVGDAAARGAAAALVERSVPNRSLPLLQVESSLTAIAACATAYRRTWSGPVLGVTGSAGKTTVTALIRSILGVCGKVSSTRGNWNNRIGLPMSMLEHAAPEDYGVYELGTNHPGEIGELAGILKPDLAVLSNVGPAHIGNFGSLDAIRREKHALLQAIPEAGAIILNLEEREHVQGCAAGRVVSAGLDDRADFHASTAGCTPGRVWVAETSAGRALDLPLYAPGEHCALNTALAVAACVTLGVSDEVLERGLSAYETPSMRWDVETVQGATIVNDAYNANPLSMTAALRAFIGMPVSGRRWLVLGGMLELGDFAEKAHRSLGASLAGSEWAGIAVLGAEASWIAEGFVDAGGDPARVRVCEDLADAAADLNGCLSEGDAVLVKGSRTYGLEKVVALLST